MITIEDITKDLSDWKNGRMGKNALIDAIETYAKQQAKISPNLSVMRSAFDAGKSYAGKLMADNFKDAETFENWFQKHFA